MTPTTARRILALSLPLALAACGSGDKAYRQARDLFQHHQQTFAALTEDVAQCTGSGHLTVFANSGAVEQRRMVPQPICPNLDSIIAGLNQAGVKTVYISGDPPYGRIDHMAMVFVLAARNDIGSEQGSGIYYFADAQTKPRRHFRPLAGMPGHWFFRAYKTMWFAIDSL